MQLRTILLGLVLLGPAAAGCLGGGDDGALDAAATNESALNTTAPDGRGRIVAFEETSATEEGVGGLDHHHDYWAGRERVVIFETDAMMQPMQAEETVAYEAHATFRPPDGTFVYEATETVEFTITKPQRHVCEGEVTLGGEFVCTDNYAGVPRVDDPSPPTGLKLRYKHAITTSWIDAGDIVWDAPVAIKITNPIQTDMPHATSSVWEFQVLSPNKADSTLTFTAKAEIVRDTSGEVPLWPGHPDFYVDSPTRKVLSASWGACDTQGCALAGDDVGPIHAEKLVSYGTRTLYVWVNITDYQAPNPALAPTNWFLFHRNATGRDNVTNVFDSENHPIDKREHLWILPVDDNGMDSPYADGSRWNFELGAALQTLLSCYGGCAQWSAKYTIDIVATNVELPLAEYDMYCLRDDYCPTPDSAGRR
jgi:hypothetical protein